MQPKHDNHQAAAHLREMNRMLAVRGAREAHAEMRTARPRTRLMVELAIVAALLVGAAVSGQLGALWDLLFA